MARLANIPLFIKVLQKSLVLAFLIVVCIFNPGRADAAFGSLVSSFLTKTTEAADDVLSESPIRTISSQNVALLAALPLADPKPDTKASTDITIVANSALMAETGPLGTIADVTVHEGGSDAISVYVIREGDTLQKVADMFNVSVNTIVWGNDLRGPKDIRVGQELIILPVSGIKYTVKKGDTLLAIAKKHGGDLDEILRFNNMDKSAKLAIGDEIIIPNGEIKAVPTPTKSGVTNVIKTFVDSTIDSIAYYIRPVANGRRTQGLHGKNGVDIAPACRCVGKEALLASAAGRVIVAKVGGWNGGYGNYVVISHPNGTQSLYGHMHSLSVQSGDTVVQGEMIGTVGSSGNSTGPHVHFEIRGAKNPF